jgi:hypothetical protein
MTSLTSVLPIEPTNVENAVQVPIPDVEFSTKDGKHYIRRLHGKERMSALTSLVNAVFFFLILL